jgi:hypothetical protein
VEEVLEVTRVLAQPAPVVVSAQERRIPGGPAPALVADLDTFRLVVRNALPLLFRAEPEIESPGVSIRLSLRLAWGRQPWSEAASLLLEVVPPLCRVPSRFPALSNRRSAPQHSVLHPGNGRVDRIHRLPGRL